VQLCVLARIFIKGDMKKSKLWLSPPHLNGEEIKYIRQAFKLHSFLIIGLGICLIGLLQKSIFGNKLQLKDKLMPYSLLFLWVFLLLAAYTYYYFVEAFYIDYFREFLPPLVIIFAAWLCHAVPAFNRDKILERFVLGGLCISTIMFYAVPHFKELIGQGSIVCLWLA